MAEEAARKGSSLPLENHSPQAVQSTEGNREEKLEGDEDVKPSDRRVSFREEHKLA